MAAKAVAKSPRGSVFRAPRAFAPGSVFRAPRALFILLPLRRARALFVYLFLPDGHLGFDGVYGELHSFERLLAVWRRYRDDDAGF